MRVILVGATGAMGHVVTDLCKEEEGIEIVAGVGLGSGEGDYLLYSSLDQVSEEADVLIDFSVPENLAGILKHAKEHKLPLVLATTGYTEEQERQVEELAKEVPIFYSGNYSLGVYALKQVTELLARELEDFDIEIVEEHHHFKQDAPSGTAKMLLSAVEAGRGEVKPVYGREGRVGKRDPKEVGMHSLRAGTIVGEHLVLFAGEDEVLEIRHRAGSKKIFAKGAIKAAHFLQGREPGLYEMKELFRK